MDEALDSYVIRGLEHNISLLRDICGNKNFRDGNITTAFLNHEYPDGFHGKPCLLTAIVFFKNTANRSYMSFENRDALWYCIGD